MSTVNANPDDKLMNWVAERDLRDTMDHDRRERFSTEKYRGAFLIMTLVAVLQITVLLLVANGMPLSKSVAVTAGVESPSALTRIPDGDRQLGFDDFEVLEIGVSYPVACSLLGHEGHPLARCRFEGAAGVIDPLETIVYAWISADGSSITATFQNDRLIAKSQSGLPARK